MNTDLAKRFGSGVGREDALLPSWPAVASPDAFVAELIAAHGTTVLRVCRRVLDDEHLAADAAQIVYGRLWRRLLDGPLQNPGGWLRRAAASAAVDLWRRRKHDALPLDTEVAASATTDPERRFDLAELDHRLTAAIRELPDAQRQVFLLRHEADLPLGEIAALLDIEPTTARTHFARACFTLSRKLRAYAPPRDER